MSKLVLLVREPGREPRRVPLEEGTTTVGRTKDNGLVVAGANVSREHLRFERKGDAVTAENLSKVGSSLNGEKLETPRALANGDALRLGDVEIVLEIEAAKVAPKSEPPKSAPAATPVPTTVPKSAPPKPAASNARAEALARAAAVLGANAPASLAASAAPDEQTPDAPGKSPATSPEESVPEEGSGATDAEEPAAASEDAASSEASEAAAEEPVEGEAASETESGAGPRQVARRRPVRAGARRPGVVAMVAGLIAFFVLALAGTFVVLMFLDTNKAKGKPGVPSGSGTAPVASRSDPEGPANPETAPTPPAASSDDAQEKWDRLALLTPRELPFALDDFAQSYKDDPRARDAAWIAQRLRQVADDSKSRSRVAVAALLLAEADRLSGQRELGRARLVLDLVASVGSGTPSADGARTRSGELEEQARAALQDLRDRAKQALEHDGPVRALVTVLDGRDALRGLGADDDLAQLAAELEEKAAAQTASGAGGVAAGGRPGRHRGGESSGSNLREPLDLLLKLDLDASREHWAALLLSPLTVEERHRVEWTRLWCQNIERLFEDLFKQANGGGKPEVTLRGGLKGALVKADSKEITIAVKADAGGEATLVWPLKRLEPAQVLELLEPLAGHDETKLLTLAFWALRTNHDERGHAYLIDILAKHKDSLPRVSSFLAIETESQIPEGGYVVFESRLVSPEQKDKILEARKQAKEDAIAAAKDLTNQRAKPKLLKYLSRALNMCDEGYYVDGRSILTYLVKAGADIPGVGDVAKARLEAPYLRRRDMRKMNPLPGDQNGPSANRLDLYILGDGFSLDDDRQRPFDRFSEAVKRFVEHQDFYFEYDSYMNYWSVNLASKDEGISRDKVKKDTALGGEINNNIFTLNRGLVMQTLAKCFPGENDEVAFGIGNGDAMVATGGGGVAALPKNFLQSAPHEFGHAYGGLRDEYDSDPTPNAHPNSLPRPNDHVPARPVGPNVVEGSEEAEVRAVAPWKHWYKLADPKLNWTTRPIEAYEGANEKRYMFWRAQRACVMRDVGSPYCCVCMEQMVLQLYKRVRPIDRAWPEDRVIHARKGKDLTIRIALMAPRTHALETKWTIEPAPQATKPGEDPGSGGTTVTKNRPEDVKPLKPQKAQDAQADLDQVKIPGKMLTRNMLVTVEAWDPTPWVMKDEEKLLRQVKTWSVEVD